MSHKHLAWCPIQNEVSIRRFRLTGWWFWHVWHQRAFGPFPASLLLFPSLSSHFQILLHNSVNRAIGRRGHQQDFNQCTQNNFNDLGRYSLNNDYNKYASNHVQQWNHDDIMRENYFLDQSVICKPLQLSNPLLLPHPNSSELCLLRDHQGSAQDGNQT